MFLDMVGTTPTYFHAYSGLFVQGSLLVDLWGAYTVLGIKLGLVFFKASTSNDSVYYLYCIFHVNFLLSS